MQKAREAEGKGEDVEAVLDDVRMELTTVMSALQFQDIPPPNRSKGRTRYCAELGNGLGQLVGYLGIAATK